MLSFLLHRFLSVQEDKSLRLITLTRAAENSSEFYDEHVQKDSDSTKFQYTLFTRSYREGSIGKLKKQAREFSKPTAFEVSKCFLIIANDAS